MQFNSQEHATENMVATADDIAECNEWQAIEDGFGDHADSIDAATRESDYDRIEREMDEVRRAAMIRCENRRIIEDLLATKNVYVSLLASLD
jgi:hypothetical protein